jgi:hypothetical protein
MRTWLIIATLLCFGGCAPQPYYYYYYRAPQRQSLHVRKTVKSADRPSKGEAVSQAPLGAQKTNSWLESMPAVSPCAGDRLKFCKDVKGSPDVRACLMQHKDRLSEACSTQLNKSA